MDKKYSSELYKKYYLSFDTNKLPLDFDKWIQLDIQQYDLIKNTYHNTNCLFLNEYYYVVIEAKMNFNMYFGGIKYEFEKGLKYLPAFPVHHNVQIDITPEIKIYIEPNIYNRIKINKIAYDFKYYPSNELHSLLNNFPHMYENFNINDENNINYIMSFYHGISTIAHKNCQKNINENEFYLEIEKDKDNQNYPIYLYDKYIQYEFFKIYCFNSL